MYTNKKKHIKSQNFPTQGEVAGGGPGLANISKKCSIKKLISCLKLPKTHKPISFISNFVGVGLKKISTGY